MGLKCGIIGLPNVGKSTLFNAMTNLKVPSENFPFCTIKPNIGIVPVIDQRLQKISNYIMSKKIIYTYINFFDIAGLVKGASSGAGLGNNFLTNIRECNAILHMVRCFHDDNITHIYQDINPLRDIDIINTELLLSDLSSCQKYIEKKSYINKKLIHDYDCSQVIKSCIDYLQKGVPLREVLFSKKDYFYLEKFRFLTLKPVMYILNINLHKSSQDLIVKILDKFKNKNVTILPFMMSNAIFSDKDTINFFEKKIYNFSNVNNINFHDIVRSGYDLLNLITFFTAGLKETRAWTILRGSMIKEAAGLIHTDFKKGFIRAQVITYNNFIQYKGNIKKIKAAGKIRIEGKKYIVQDGDIIHFLFNV